MKRYGLQIAAALAVVLALVAFGVASRYDDLADSYRWEASNAEGSAMRHDRTESVDDIRRRAQSLRDMAFDYADDASFYRMLGICGLLIGIGAALAPVIRRQLSTPNSALSDLASKRWWNVALTVVGLAGFVGAAYFLYESWHRHIEFFHKLWFDFSFATILGGLGFCLLAVGAARLIGRRPTWLVRGALFVAGVVVVAGTAGGIAGLVWNSREKELWNAVKAHPDDRNAWSAYWQVPPTARRPEAYPLFVEKSPDFHEPRQMYELRFVLNDLIYAHGDHPLVQDARRRLEERVGPADGGTKSTK